MIFCYVFVPAFGWFVTIIAGFMIRSDMLDITSMIRNLALDPTLHNSMEHFLRADSWEWEDIFAAWVQTVSSYAPLKRVVGRAVLVGDGEKRVSNGKYMPCTKKMVQESESAFKPSFIHGHLWGTVGILAGNAEKIFYLLFKIEAMFREMKQKLGSFCYHFWTHAVPRLDRYCRKGR